MHWPRPLILASASPRRRELLAGAGIEALPCPPTMDDGRLQCGDCPPQQWVAVLAIMKARDVIAQLRQRSGTVLAADTMCLVDDKALGQPTDGEDARGMLNLMRGRDHEVLTGWCLVAAEGTRARHGTEVVTVSIGAISDAEIDRYIDSNRWRGKAGGYNLAERVGSGWPITCEGDATSVMGLPMDRLARELAS